MASRKEAIPGTLVAMAQAAATAEATAAAGSRKFREKTHEVLSQNRQIRNRAMAERAKSCAATRWTDLQIVRP